MALIDREAWMNGARPNAGRVRSGGVRYGEVHDVPGGAQGQPAGAAQTIAYQTNLILQLQAALKSTLAERDSLAVQLQALRGGQPAAATSVQVPAGQQTVQMKVVRKPRGQTPGSVTNVATIPPAQTHTPGQGPKLRFVVPEDEELDMEA